jgi:chromosome segregation ATPase
MEKNIKEIIIILLIITGVGSTISCFMLRKSSINDRLNCEDTLFKETVLKEKAQEKLLRSQNELSGLQRSVDALIQKSAALESELLSARQELAIAKDKLDKLTSRNTAAKYEISQITSNIEVLRESISKISVQAQSADKNLTFLVKAKEALAEQIEQHKKQAVKIPVAEEPVSEREEESYLLGDDSIDEERSPALEQESETGEVLTINKEFAFIVVNLGKTDGVEEGMLIDVWRDNKNLAKARVETVREHISAAALLEKENIAHIRAGDKVVIRGRV